VEMGESERRHCGAARGLRVDVAPDLEDPQRDARMQDGVARVDRVPDGGSEATPLGLRHGLR